MENVTAIFLSLILIFLGIMNIKGNISSIHRYNRMRITEETCKKYGRLMGIGTVVIGLGILFEGVTNLLFKDGRYYFFKISILVSAVIVGISIMLYAQIKYNKGIF